MRFWDSSALVPLVIQHKGSAQVEAWLAEAAGALQLGAALVWADGHPDTLTLHTLDPRLADAAAREGFHVHR